MIKIGNKMINYRNKYLVDYIKKYADGPFKDENPVAPPQPDIVNMQRAIKNFASNMAKYNTKRVPDPSAPGKFKEVVDVTDKRKDFNDFLAEQYSAGSSIRGEEWTTDVKATKKEQKLPTGIIELDNVIDGLRRIGPGSSEAMQDGVWDWRTQNAVKNVWAVADALVRVTEDFGSKLKDNFTRSDLQELANEIPKTNDIAKYDQKKKIEHAKKIAPLVEKLDRFYSAYYNSIIQSPEYASYIKQDKPLLTAKPGGVDPGKVPDDLVDTLKKPHALALINVTLPTPTGPKLFSPVSIDALKSVGELEKLMLFLGYPIQDAQNKEKQNVVLQAFLAHVNAVSPNA